MRSSQRRKVRPREQTRGGHLRVLPTLPLLENRDKILAPGVSVQPINVGGRATSLCGNYDDVVAAACRRTYVRPDLAQPFGSGAVAIRREPAEEPTSAARLQGVPGGEH
jgi:hypothetical protein